MLLVGSQCSGTCTRQHSCVLVLSGWIPRHVREHAVANPCWVEDAPDVTRRQCSWDAAGASGGGVRTAGGGSHGRLKAAAAVPVGSPPLPQGGDSPPPQGQPGAEEDRGREGEEEGGEGEGEKGGGGVQGAAGGARQGYADGEAALG